ncbi:uncharacterized protein LOC135471689 [Liolophura sinensis]|uniref:uncharacterized protein LOC135471689 n=1 Tax=Liolophura sinensis TaxID=3198878 RepID=UPI0031598C91
MEEGKRRSDCPLLVVDFHDKKFVSSLRDLIQNFDKATTQELFILVIWNSTDIDLRSVMRIKSHHLIRITQSHTRFLNSQGDAAKMINHWTPACVVLVDGGISFGPKELHYFVEKFREYESTMILCSQGLRLFPHKPFADTTAFWTSGRYIEYYNKGQTDREVHLFVQNRGCTLFPTLVLTQSLISSEQFSSREKWDNIGDFQISLIAQQKMKTHIWKVQLNINDGNNTDYFPSFPTYVLEELGDFYQRLRRTCWPDGTFWPILPKESIGVRSKSKIWSEGIHGLNMSAEPVPLDFDAARAYGTSVVRFGATNDAKDLGFLINDIPDGNLETDRVHLELSLERLRNSVISAGESGLKVILTLCDLPGRRFRDSTDDRMWQSEKCRQRIANLWGSIAEGLADLSDFIVGFDIINEPFTPDDKDLSFYCDMSPSYKDKLHDLYVRALKAIRAVDKETMVIVESSFWASPRTVPFITPLDDPHVVYSFHFYAPSLYTFRHENHGQFSYPGKVPKWRKDKWADAWPVWNEHKIREVIQPVVKWQKENSIQSSMIFVGEFGVSREVPGALQYLLDTMNMWEENGWSWCLFSFRDNEWDAMDYELGENKTNQIDRKPSEMMKTIAKYLY